MDRLWSNVARTPKPDYEEKPRAAEIVMDPRLEDPRKEGVGLTLGSLVPDFVADSTQGKIEWHRWMGEGWTVLFGYPNDFQPVAATELAYLAQARHEFEERGIKVAAVSKSSVEDHLVQLDVTAKELCNASGHAIAFPLISDPDHSITETYGMFDTHVKDPTDMPKVSRGVFLIGPDKRLKFSILYPTHTGRNIKELLRVMDSLTLESKHGVWSTVNWTPGDMCAVDPDRPDEYIRDKYGKFKQHPLASGRHYLRYVEDPSPHGKSGSSAMGVFRSILGVASGMLIGLVAGKYVKPSKG